MITTQSLREKLLTRQALVIDPRDAESSASVLRNSGLTVMEAKSLREAAEIAAWFEPRIVIADIGLAKGRWRTLVPRIVALSSRARVIVIGDFVSIAEAVEVMRSGAFSIIEKPLTQMALRSELFGSPRAPEDLSLAPATLSRALREHVYRVFVEAEGNTSEAARRLQMHRRTLQRILGRPSR